MSSSIQLYLDRLTPKGAEVTKGILGRWMVWLQENGEKFADFTPDQLIEYQLEHKNYEILDSVQAYIRSLEGRRIKYKQKIYSAVVNYFAHNRAPLPPDPRFKIRSDKPAVMGILSVDEVRRVLDSCNPRYRAIFLCMFQGGMGVGELVEWSDNGYADLMSQLGAGAHPIRVDFTGRKANRNLKPYYTFIGRDAIEALRVYLEERGPGDGPIFRSMMGNPISVGVLQKYWLEHLKKLGIVTPIKLGPGVPRGSVRYGRNPHEIRDVVRSRWRPSGADVEVAEFFMGHDLDRLGYDKSPWHYPDWFRGQYLLAEPWLNIVTEDPEKVPRDQILRYEEEVRQLRDRIEELRPDNEYMEMLKELFEHPEAQEGLVELIKKLRSSN